MIKLPNKLLLYFKYIVAIAAYGFVFVKLYRKSGDGFLSSIAKSDISGNWVLIPMVLLLMLVAWSIEAFKWKFIIKPIQPTSFFISLKTVWYGVVTGLITPNRVGDPIGRMAMTGPENRGKAGVVALLCSMSQQVATFLFGFLGLFMWTKWGFVDTSIPYWGVVLLLLLVLVFVVVLVVLFGVSRFSQSFQRLTFVRKLLSGESLKVEVAYTKILYLILLSILRYSVFSTQYVLLLIFFGSTVEVVHLFAAIFLTYLFTSVIPSFAATEIGVRASFAIVFLGAIWSNPSAIIAATLSLWVVNIAMPGLIAAWFPFYKHRSIAKR